MPNPYVLLGALVSAIVIAISAFFYGEHVEGLDWKAKWADRERELAEGHAKTTDEYRERERVLQDAIGLLDKDYTKQLEEANHANDDLRRAVDAGAQRLRIRAQCPAAPGVPQAADRSGVDHGAGAELAADARPDYFALREGLIRVDKKLSACQAALLSERANEQPQPEGR